MEISKNRLKAIKIMEEIADYLGKPKMFDCRRGDTRWYDVEDLITGILDKK